MRVLAVSTWMPTTSSPSTGSFVIKDARAIAGLGHHVALVHLAPPGQLGDDPLEDEIHGLRVARIPMSTTDPRSVASAAAQLRRLVVGADLLHTMAFSSLLPLATRRPGVPWVHTEHWSGLTAPQTLPRSWRTALPVLTPLLRRPDVATAVCDYLAEPVRRIRGARPTRVVPCIVPPVPDLVPRRHLDHEVRMVSVGGLIDRKDPLLAVDTVAELRERGVDASLRLVGEGPLRGAIGDHAVARGVDGYVECVGTRDRDGVLEELGTADLFLGPTRGDNFFVSCAEAITAGRPVVVGATGGQGEYIEPQVGLTVADHTPEAFATAVQRVLDRSRHLTAEDIAATVGDRFAEPTVAAGYQAVYDEATALAGASR